MINFHVALRERDSRLGRLVAEQERHEPQAWTLLLDLCPWHSKCTLYLQRCSALEQRAQARKTQSANSERMRPASRPSPSLLKAIILHTPAIKTSKC